MKFRSTVIYLLAAVALAAFYLYETRKEAKEDLAKEEQKLLFLFKPGQLDGLTVKRDRDSVQIEKKGGAGQAEWEIISPIRTPADPFALSRFANRLAALRSERLITENPKDLSEFGLDKPSLVVDYRAGKEEGSLLFGSRSPIGRGVYAMAGSKKKVVLLSSLDKQELDKTLFDLRNKKLLTMETDKVNGVIIERKSSKWVLYKKDGRWFLEGDEGLKIGTEKVELAIRPIAWAEALTFETEASDDLKPYGLDKPAARVILSNGSKTEEMILGDFPKQKNESSVYAMVKGKPQVVTVRKRLLEDLPTEKEQLKQEEPNQQNKEGSR